MRLREAVVRWGWLLPLIGLVLLLGGTWYLDRQTRDQLERRHEQAAAGAEQDAARLAEDIASEVAERIGALAAAKLQFTQVEDSLSQQTFVEAVDSVIGAVQGLSAVSVVYPDGRVISSPVAALPRRGVLDHRELVPAYERAVESRRPAATPLLELGGERRFVVFEPVAASDTSEIRAVLAAELEPLPILREALEQQRSQLRPAFYDVFDQEGTRITTVPAPDGWPRIHHAVQVADSEWNLFVAHQPVSVRSLTATALAIRVAGVLLALGFAASLLVLWRLVVGQQGEIRLRQAAESEARDLNEQLGSAQRSSLRLSGAMDPDRVIDEFLGSVGVEIGADVGRLYDFEENGDVLVGRRLVVLDRALAEDGGPSEERFRKVRLKVSLVPHLAEAVFTGEATITRHDGRVAGVGEGDGAPTTSLTVPLAIGGHLVGLAVWESRDPHGAFQDSSLPFARAVAGHAAAALRAAELLEGVRQARQRAHKEAVRLATVLDQLGDGVVLFDRDGHPERVNPAAETLLGHDLVHTPLEEWPRAFRMRLGGPAQEEFIPGRVLRGEAIRPARVTVRTGGAERYLAVSAAPIRGDDDAIRGAAVVLRDVTAEHEYAEMLRHTNQELRQQAALLERMNDDLRAATAAKDQFLAMMSHELRTPINAIIGYSQILEEGVHGGLTEQQRWMLSRVTDTSRHLLGLIEEVLDLAKIGAGRIKLEIQDVALAPLVERATNQVMPLAAEKGLEVGAEGGVGMRVAADETRLLQILINLCSNAVKFTDDGSVTVRAEEAAGEALIQVRDTGPGIAPDQLETVFEEFHQVDSGLARKVGGSGLGLTISRRLARLMGGDITVQSEVGVGTEFTVRLPLVRADRVAAEVSRGGGAGPARPR